ncbi:MinD/ParA family protein [Mycetocola sp. 2940]|uniref:MinD/ParA family ATP-binding protein n=1 Tax=Mycetocola sp. 2940 TaxID=3156452 RepID=UPI003391AB19
MAPTRSDGGSARHTSDDVVAPKLENIHVDTAAIDVVGETPRVTVQLPASPIHDIPEDERAVAIDDVPVNPDTLAADPPSTRSVEVVEPVATVPTQDAPAGISATRYATGAPETSALLTSERLLDGMPGAQVAPEGRWQRFVYNTTFHRVNLGDSAAATARKELDRRIRRPVNGGARFVPVLTRKGGVGKTTVTALLGMALADAREDRTIAIDANPDRGTLSERIAQHTDYTVRDIVRDVDAITGYTEFSKHVARDSTRLDVLASDTDPHLAEAFNEDDYTTVAELAARYYSFVLTDCGTGIVHSVMRATLGLADSVVIVSGSSVDEARLASETLTWLEQNGYEHLVANSVVALNTATQGAHMVRLDEIESHFKSRVREIVRIPYDPQLAAGAAIDFHNLRPVTRHAARILAAHVVEGLPSRRR